MMTVYDWRSKWQPTTREVGDYGNWEVVEARKTATGWAVTIWDVDHFDCYTTDEQGLAPNRSRDLLPVEQPAEATTTDADKLAFLKSKGIMVGLATDSAYEQPYLVYVIERDSELCDSARKG